VFGQNEKSSVGEHRWVAF